MLNHLFPLAGLLLAANNVKPQGTVIYATQLSTVALRHCLVENNSDLTNCSKLRAWLTVISCRSGCNLLLKNQDYVRSKSRVNHTYSQKNHCESVWTQRTKFNNFKCSKRAVNTPPLSQYPPDIHFPDFM